MWARVANMVLGAWLMAAPAVLGYGGSAATNDYIIGPTVASCACIALWEVTRPLRWISFACGLWLLIAPFVLGYESAAMANSLLVGCAIAGAALYRGKIESQFGGGWSSLWKSPGGSRSA